MPASIYQMHDVSISVTHISLASLLWGTAPDVTPQNAASHLGLVCLHREISSKNETKNKITPNTPKNESDLTQLITMGESIRQIRVNLKVVYMFFSTTYWRKTVQPGPWTIVMEKGAQDQQPSFLQFSTATYTCTRNFILEKLLNDLQNRLYLFPLQF